MSFYFKRKIKLASKLLLYTLQEWNTMTGHLPGCDKDSFKQIENDMKYDDFPQR